MKILFLALDVDMSRERGDSVHVRELAENFARLGHEIVLVSATPEGRVPRGLKHARRPDSTLAQILSVRKHASRWADVLYERRMSPKVSWAVSKLTGVPFVVEVNGILDDEIAALRRKRARRNPPLRVRIRARMMRTASRVVVVSRGIRDYLLASYRLDGDRVFIVPNGANTELFRPLDGTACRAGLGIPEDCRVVCFVGNLVRWQGVDYLLRACENLKSGVPHTLTLIVGAGPEENRLRKLALDLRLNDSVRFVGAVPYLDVPKFINAADVCVAPFERSRKASPIKVFEYLGCGKPVVASDVDEIGDFLRTSGGGLVVEPEDAGSLTAAIEWLLKHKEEASAMGSRGRDSVVKTRSWIDTARQVIEVLESVRFR